MKNNNVLGKVLTIEDANGDSVMVIKIDEKGNIVDYWNGSVISIESESILGKGDNIRVQTLYGEFAIDEDKIAEDLENAKERLENLDETMECCGYGKAELQEREALADKVDILEHFL